MIDPRAILAYDNRFHTHARNSKAATFTGTAGTWASAQPLSNLGRQQLDQFAAFTSADATLDCAAVDSADAAQTFSADVLALLGHTLPEGTLVEFLNGADLIAAATWRPVFGSPPHLVVVLPEPSAWIRSPCGSPTPAAAGASAPCGPAPACASCSIAAGA